MSDKTLKKARGLNSIADPSAFRGTKGRREHIATPVVPIKRESPAEQLSEPIVETPKVATPKATPHRAVVPGTNRTRRELSVPVPVAEALEKTGINPADVVMAAYRKHSDDIFAGEKGRMVSKGRVRLRLSISDSEFEQITRLGSARGWNRSETVSVLLAAELIEKPTQDEAAIVL